MFKLKNIISKIKNKIKNKIKKEDEDNPEYRTAFANRIKDKKIRYVSERITDEKTGEVVDTIIGKDGFFHINARGEFVLSCGGRELFRAVIAELRAYEFLSLEGVVLDSFDLISNRRRQIIAYYKYHR